MACLNPDLGVPGRKAGYAAPHVSSYARRAVRRHPRARRRAGGRGRQEQEEARRLPHGQPEGLEEDGHGRQHRRGLRPRAEPQGPSRPDRADHLLAAQGQEVQDRPPARRRQRQAHEGRQVPLLLRAPARRLLGQAGHVLPDRLRPPRQRHAQGRVRPQAAEGGAKRPPARRLPVDTRNTSRKLRDAITAAGMLDHLKALQAIADEHGGNRASGFAGLRRLACSTSSPSCAPRATTRRRRSSTS